MKINKEYEKANDDAINYNNTYNSYSNNNYSNGYSENYPNSYVYENNRPHKTSKVAIILLCSIPAVFIIGYFLFFGFVFYKGFSFANETVDKANKTFDKVTENTSRNYNKIKNMQGTQLGVGLKDDLDDVVTYNKTTNNSTITVVYNDISSDKEEDIVKIKNSLEEGKFYEVSIDYDGKKNVNKITITDNKELNHNNSKLADEINIDNKNKQ